METIEVLNERLKNRYGVYLDGQSLFRIVFSDDQFEKRLIDCTKEGLQLLLPKVEERPKYRQYIQHKYLIERLLEVPDFVETDLVSKLTYEPIWVFEDSKGNPLPPKWEVCEIVIDQIHRASAGAVGKKVDEQSVLESDPKTAPEARIARIDRIQEELFGNESKITDSLATEQAIVVPAATKLGE